MRGGLGSVIRVVALSSLIVAACTGRRFSRSSSADDAQNSPRLVATSVPVDAALEQASSDRGPADGRSIYDELTQEAPNRPLLLTVRGKKLLVVDSSGHVVRQLLDQSMSRARYDAETAVVWFLRGQQLVAMDLAHADLGTLIVAEGMPDLDYLISPDARLAEEYCPPACVSILVGAAPAVAVAISSDGHINQKEAEAATKVARVAHPHLTKEGTSFLAQLAQRAQGARRDSKTRPVVSLSQDVWPIPSAATRQGGCKTGCGHGFAWSQLARVLVVTGRRCDCRIDQCAALCVWFDPNTRTYASLSAPHVIKPDVAGEPWCHPLIAATGSDYILPLSPGTSQTSRVCTLEKGCHDEAGIVLGWLQVGSSTEDIPEDTSSCPE